MADIGAETGIGGAFVEEKSVWRICRELVRGYWVSEEKWKARGLLAVVVTLNFITVGMLVLINDWYNEFYNALQGYEYELFWPLVGKFAVLAFLHIAVAVYAIYLRQMLQIKWRSWLTERYLARWMDISSKRSSRARTIPTSAYRRISTSSSS